MKFPRVKICGITNLEDALCAIKHGADALGFVFYEKSPRYIEPQKAHEIVTQLPPFIQKIGLFVNVDAKRVNLICKESFMDVAQIHFEANSQFFDALEVPHLKVIRANKKEDILKHKDKYRLVDAFVQSYGGEGKRVDVSWFDEVDCSKIILAGGLDADNLAEVKELGFYAYDVSSGVEVEKGKKDKKKIEEFIKEAKS